MKRRRTLSIVLALGLAAAASACSTPTTVALRADPSDSPTRTRFENREEIEVVGYTRVSDGHREWKGTIRLAAPDSVQFTARSKTGPARARSTPSRPLSFRIALADLASIDIRGEDAVPVTK